MSRVSGSTNDESSAHSPGDLSVSAANRLMLAVIAISTGLFTWLAYLQYAYFTADANDLTIVTYAFARATKGYFFPLYYAPGTLLGNHPDIIYLLIFPVYAIVRTVPFLFFLQSLLLSASAWPLYLLARRKLADNVAAIAIACAYLIFPTVASQHLNQIHDDQFANISILFAAYFFEREQFRNMSIALVLAALTKEVVALTVAMFGVWGWLNRRSWKWVVFPVVLGFGWFFIGVKLMLTFLPGAGAALYTGTPYLDLYGKSPHEVLHTMLTRPGFVLQNTFGPEKQKYLWKLLGPLGLVAPLFSSAIVLVLPNLAINLVGTNTALIYIPWHYGVVLGAALFVALVYSLANLGIWLSKRFGQKRYARGIAFAAVVAALCSTGLWLDTSRFDPPLYLSTLRRAVDAVPLDASVLCPTPMIAHFSNRPKINTGYSILVGSLKNPAQLTDYDYVLLDGNWRTGEAYGQVPLYDAVKNDPAYQVVFMENNVLLLHHVK